MVGAPSTYVVLLVTVCTLLTSMRAPMRPLGCGIEIEDDGNTMVAPPTVLLWSVIGAVGQTTATTTPRPTTPTATTTSAGTPSTSSVVSPSPSPPASTSSSSGPTPAPSVVCRNSTGQQIPCGTTDAPADDGTSLADIGKWEVALISVCATIVLTFVSLTACTIKMKARERAEVRERQQAEVVELRKQVEELRKQSGAPKALLSLDVRR